MKNKRGLFPIPAIASVILPGIGQLLKGHFNKALIFLVFSAGWWLFSWLVTWIPIVGWAVPTFFAIVAGLDALVSNSDAKS
ncbi:MAG: hypothetical protein AAF570_25215 [Bacteroidota bacterium]